MVSDRCDIGKLILSEKEFFWVKLWVKFNFLVLEKHLKSSIRRRQPLFAGSFKSQLIDYFRGAITSWELVEGSLWQFYDNET